MEIEERKKVIHDALITSFVDDYKAYKSTIKIVNKDLKKSKINFQYSYDQFCVDFLNQSLSNIQDFDIFKVSNFNQFYINFWQFNLYNLQCMLNRKLNTLGYEYEDFYKTSNIKQKINKKYLN